MFLKLFNENPVKELFADFYLSIENRVKLLDISFIDISLFTKQIYDEFQLHTPKFYLDEISSNLKLEDRNGKVYQENSSGRYDGLDVYVTSTITIPISGYEDYFGLRPSLNHSQIIFYVQISDGKIEYKIRVNSFNKLDLNEQLCVFVKKETKNYVDFINSNLANLEKDFLYFNESIVPLTTKLLEEKKRSSTKR
jgi:hypothetical protein